MVKLSQLRVWRLASVNVGVLGMSKINLLRGIGIVIALGACLTACSPEEYGPCSIPNTKAHTVACSPIGESKSATCAVDYVFDCDSLICGIYDNSDAFCTHRCLPKSNECTSQKGCTKAELDEAGLKYKTDCPEGGHCVEFIKGTAAYYCMPDDMYKKKGVDKYQSAYNTSSNSSSSTEPDNSNSESTEEPAG